MPRAALLTSPLTRAGSYLLFAVGDNATPAARGTSHNVAARMFIASSLRWSLESRQALAFTLTG